MRHLTRRAVFGGALASAGLLAIGGDTMSALSTSDYDQALAEMTQPLADSPDVIELVRYATLAANGHNTQPWLIRATNGGIDILPDLSRRTPAVDSDGHHLYVSLGCASENLSLAARARGKSGEVSFFPEDKGRIHVDLEPGVVEMTSLFAAIPQRQSVRAVYDGKPVPVEVMANLDRVCRIDGVEPMLITEPGRIASILELVIAGNSRQMDDRAYLAELRSWLRFNPRAAARARDGLFSAASGNPVLPSWLGRIMYDLAFSKDGENQKYVEQIRSSSGALVLVAPTNDPKGWAAAGRASQRFALQATADGLKVAFVNQAVEDVQARGDLQNLLGLGARRPNLVMRFGYGPAMPRSLRRPAREVILTK
jgi:hypothetical protein